MPPKVVYGKKKTVARTHTSFTKLIAHEKDTVQQASGIDDFAMQREVDAMEVLEKGFSGMELGERRSVDGKKIRKSRERKEEGDKDTGGAKENWNTVGDGEKTRDRDGVLGERVARTRKKAVARTLKDERDGDEKVREPRSRRPRTPKHAVDSHSSPTKVRHSISTAAPKQRVAPTQPSSQIPRATSPPANVYSTYASPLYAMSDTKHIQTFDEWSAELESHFEVTKIAEASFSEVYRLSTINPSGGSTQESVLKLVALKTPQNVPLPCQANTRAARDREGQIEKEQSERDEKDQWKSDVEDVVSEVKLLQNLNQIPGFTDFRDLTVLQGRPTCFFAKAWKEWNKSRPRGKKSEFPDPSKKASYEETQLWAVIEMQDAGTDCEKLMENGGLRSIWEVWDVFWGVCLSVAKAEENCKFEHRDLHLGNICVRSSNPNSDVMAPSIQDPTRRKLGFTALETTVIDYTLSRADILASPSRRSSSSSTNTLTSSSSAADPAQTVAYFDLDKDPAVFEGDASEEYQYEIYRYMRGAVLYDNPLQQHAPEPQPLRRSPRKNTHIRFDSMLAAPMPAENPWSLFHPKTNLVWAHFLLHKLLAHVDLSDTSTLANITDRHVDVPKTKSKALKLHAVLKKVAELLCPVALGRGEGLGSVKDLVLWALEARWLRVRDVVG